MTAKSVTRPSLIRNASWAIVWEASRGHAYRTDVDVRLANGQIGEIAPGGTLQAGPGDSVLEGRGFLLMPGLVDIHSHPSTEPSFRGLREDHGVPEQYMTGLHERSQAFRLDATKLRYRNWDDLMGYCRYSASPVGRQLLDLHGESRDTWPPSDALCSALQVLNHLQDCAADYHALDRVYLPLDDLGAAGCTVEALAAPVAVPGLRRVIDSLLDRTEALIAAARDLPPRVAARGLRWESAVIVALAGRLALRLRQRPQSLFDRPSCVA